MSTSLLDQYDALQARLHLSAEMKADAQAKYASAAAAHERIEAELALARAGIEAALASSGGAQSQQALAPDSPAETGEADGAPPAPPGVRRSVWEIIVALPMEGELTIDALRSVLNVSTSALNTRLVVAKEKGWVESAGWGRCRLTLTGKALRGRRLHVVNAT